VSLTERVNEFDYNDTESQFEECSRQENNRPVLALVAVRPPESARTREPVAAVDVAPVERGARTGDVDCCPDDDDDAGIEIAGIAVVNAVFVVLVVIAVTEAPADVTEVAAATVVSDLFFRLSLIICTA
jgi:hypothetical protein